MNEIEKEIIYKYKNGEHKHNLAKEFTMSERAISNILKKNNVPTIVAAGDNRKLFFHPEQIIELYTLHNASLKDIGLECGVGESVIKRVLEFNGFEIKNRGQKIHRDRNYFKKIDNEEKAYILGLIFSDGSISEKGNLSITQKSERKDVVENFCKILKSQIHYEKTKDQYYSSVQNLEWARDLAQYGIIPRKSTNTFSLPLDLIPLNLRHHFLRGLFDGDGLCYFNKQTLVLGFCSNSENIVREFFDEMNFKDDFTIWHGTVYFSNKSNIEWIDFFYNKIYQNSHFYCASKKEKIEKRLRKIPS